MSEIEVREAVVEDALPIARVHVETWQFAYRGQIPDSYLDSLSIARRANWHSTQLANPTPKVHTLVALDDSEISGFCSVGASRDEDADEYCGELYAIYVDAHFMGKGAGSALITEGERRLRADGFTHATLWVLTTNLSARGFYEHQGWADDGTRKTDTVADFQITEARYARELSIDQT